MKHHKTQSFLPRIQVKKVLARTEDKEKQVAMNINNINEEN